jgi:hypothetical protein
MATGQGVCREEIPPRVEAREAGRRQKERSSRRVRDLIEIVAAKRNLDSADDYIKSWARFDAIRALAQTAPA